MKILYLIILLSGLYLGFSYGRYKYILSHANLAEINHVAATRGAGPGIKYMAAGDSTAVGEGGSDVTRTYPDKIAEYLASTHTVEYENVAVRGSQTQDVIDKQLAHIINFNPDVVTISIGANDVTHWVKSSKIIENYKTIANELTNKTKAKIYITNVPRFDYAYLLPWPLRRYYDRQAERANLEIQKLETNRVKIVDIHSVGVDNSADQFHPSDKGYENWTHAFISKIKQ